MDATIYAANSIKTLGEVSNSRKCFEARDDHFTCLDSFNDLKDNHYKCNGTYVEWQKFCPDGSRNLQQAERGRQKINNRLYTQEQLDDYSKRKNAKAWFNPNSY